MRYNYFTIEKRVSLQDILKFKKSKNLSYRDIGENLGICHTTIIREVNSNGGVNNYDAYKAHEKSLANKSNRGRKSKLTPEIKQVIEEGLKNTWSPEQTIGNKKLNISIKSIYNYIRDNLIESNNSQLLRFKGKRRNKNEKRGKFTGKKSIDQRPEIANNRSEFGHYEIDTVYSSRKSKECLVTLNERMSRKYWAIKIKSRKASEVKKAVDQLLSQDLVKLIESITADRGKEFALHEELENNYGIDFYFCDPYCSWQRGANEQLNGLLREFFPKKTDFSKVSQKEINKAVNLINNRPRKCLNYKTPNEVFNELSFNIALVQ